MMLTALSLADPQAVRSVGQHLGASRSNSTRRVDTSQQGVCSISAAAAEFAAPCSFGMRRYLACFGSNDVFATFRCSDIMQQSWCWFAAIGSKEGHFVLLHFASALIQQNCIILMLVCWVATIAYIICKHWRYPS